MKYILFQMKYYPPRPIASSLPSHDASSVLKETDYGTFHRDLILEVIFFIIEVTLELLLSVNSFFKHNFRHHTLVFLQNASTFTSWNKQTLFLF